MKRVAWILALAFVLGIVAGCGDRPESNTTTAARPESAVTAPSSEQNATAAAATPEQSVTAFLDALRNGNEQTAEALLTTTAREETARNDMVVQPPGTPNATYRIGRVEYPDGQEGTAYVECIWTEALEDGSKDEYEVVWVLREEPKGWLIGGMATELVQGGPIVFLDFEKPNEMMEKIRQAQQPAAQQFAGQSGEQPSTPEPGQGTTPGTTASRPDTADVR